MSNLSDTEKKLADIWKKVLDLSEKEFETLNPHSDFFKLINNFCVMSEVADLTVSVENIFRNV